MVVGVGEDLVTSHVLAAPGIGAMLGSAEL